MSVESDGARPPAAAGATNDAEQFAVVLAVPEVHAKVFVVKPVAFV